MSTITEDLLALRQLLHREQAFFDIELQKIKLFQKDSYDSIKKLIFLTRKVYSLHLSIIEQMKTGSLISVPDLITLTKNFPSGFTATQQRAYQNSISTIKDTNNLENSAKEVSKYLKEHPESENYILFSLIPALFSCFWSEQEVECYIDFFNAFDPEFHPLLTKVLLVHQSFYVFLDSVRIDAESVLQDQKQLSELIEIFSKRSFLFPKSLRMLLNRENRKQYFVESILKPVLINPSLYGLVPCIESKTFEYMLPQIDECGEIIEKFIESVATAKNYIRIHPNEQNLYSVLSKNEQLIYLFKEDCKLLVEILNRDTEIPKTDDVFQIPYKRERNFSEDAGDERNELEDQSDPFESLIRSLVIRLDFTKPRGGFIETIEYAVALQTGPARLQCELQFDELRQMMKVKNSPNDIPYYIQLLRNKYDERMAHRQATLSGKITKDSFKILFTQCSQATEFLYQKKDNLILSDWDNAVHPFDEADKQTLNLNPQFFLQTFTDLINKFKAHVDANKLVISQERFLPLLYARLTKVVSLSSFVDSHPDTAKLDERISKVIKEHKEKLIQMNSQSWLEKFQENPSLLGLSADCLSRAADEDISLNIMYWIDKSLNALQYLLSFYGFKEIGADILVPASIFLFILVNPPRICSIAAYLEHTILSDELGVFPISPSLQYWATLANSVSKWFREKITEFPESA